MISPDDRLALGHARIVEFHKFFSEFSFMLEADDDLFRITLKIWETSDGRFFFTQSHFVKTPLMSTAGTATHLSHDSSNRALTRGVEAIVSYYDDAVGRGHRASADWFLPNPLF